MVNMNLLKQNLARIEYSISNQDVEYGAMLDKTGKLVFKTTSDKSEVVDLRKDLKKYDKLAMKNFIFTHNHPLNYTMGNIPILSSLSPEDIATIVFYNFRGGRAVDGLYTYVLKRPARGWGKLTNREFTKYFNDIFTQVEKEWQDKVINGKMTLKYYETNYSHEITKRVCAHFGWEYFRKTNARPTLVIHLKGEVVPPRDIPKWLKNSKNPNAKIVIAKYKKYWDEAVKLMPELKKTA